MVYLVLSTGGEIHSFTKFDRLQSLFMQIFWLKTIRLCIACQSCIDWCLLYLQERKSLKINEKFKRVIG